MKFYDRKEELKVLEDAYSRHGSEMIIVNAVIAYLLLWILYPNIA